MDLTEKTIRKAIMYRGRILNVRCDDVLLPNGHTSVREVVDHHGGVCILAVRDDGKILFVRQFRYSYGEPVLELPAGKLEAGATSGRTTRPRATRTKLSTSMRRRASRRSARTWTTTSS